MLIVGRMNKIGVDNPKTIFFKLFHSTSNLLIMQQKSEWYEQWELLQCNELFLFKDWIYPATLKDFRGKDVLECGCGGGQHTSFVSPFAKSVTAVDLNTVDIAKER